MDQAELLAHTVKRFRAAQKKISVRQQVIEKMLNDPPLGVQIEVDQYVSTENRVHAFHERHSCIIREIQPAEADVRTSRSIHPELITLRKKILAPVGGSEISRTVAAVNCRFGIGKRTLVEIGGENFDGPVFEPAVDLVQQQHPESVGFFPGRAASTPDANAALPKSGLEPKNVRYHDVAQSIELRLIAKKAGFPDRDLVEQSDQFCLPNRPDREALKILPQDLHLEFLHTAPATVLQEEKFIVWMKNPSRPVNQVADAHQVGFGPPGNHLR
jgi:hypothetical protein